MSWKSDSIVFQNDFSSTSRKVSAAKKKLNGLNAPLIRRKNIKAHCNKSRLSLNAGSPLITEYTSFDYTVHIIYIK